MPRYDLYFVVPEVSLPDVPRCRYLMCPELSLPDVPRYDLYFVVPEDVYPSFSAQLYLRADDDNKAVAALDTRVKRVQQWALCISLKGPFAASGRLDGGATHSNEPSYDARNDA